MNQADSIENTPTTPKGEWLKRIFRVFLFWLLPLCIVALSLGAYYYQMETRPKAARRPPERQARLVSVESLHRTTHRAVIPVMGTVRPAREITLRPEVTGVITEIDPVVVPGGIIHKGQVLFQIDARDYQAVVRQRESEVERARLNLKIESGSQTIARHEYNLLGDIVEEQDEELVLRKPHLEQARAALAAAEALLNQAKLNVQRCTIRAPFNAVIKEKYADLGARVSPSDALVSIIGVDTFWVELRVPVNQIDWMEIPGTPQQPGSAVHITNPSAWGEEVYRKGRIIRLLGHLEEQGRMAQVLAAVDDPLGLKDSGKPPLLIGSYVRAEIQGRTIENVFPIRREYLRGGNRVWIMNEDNHLEIRPAEIVFRSKDTVYIRNGFQEGERIVTTYLSAPVEGMPLRTAESTAGDPLRESAAGDGSDE